jgi:hypothetical protein
MMDYRKEPALPVNKTGNMIVDTIRRSALFKTHGRLLVA